ncbi:MAG TPA: hypothetical protein VFU07_07080 [Candidatus Lumbricidophila sp.]|nr:hypothetical protein [Candidatus Lumbricidophila sp.]
MFDTRVRLYTPAGVRGKVLPALASTHTRDISSQASLRFTTSPLIAGTLPDRFVVAYEYQTAAGWVEARGGRLVANQDDADTADATQVVNFTAVEYVPWLLRAALVGDDAKVDGERVFTNATVGQILGPLLTAAVARGAAQGVTWDFSATDDSIGVAWPAGDKVTLTFRATDTIASVLDTLASQGLCEWWTEGLMLRVVRPGTGYDHTNGALPVVLGVGAQRAPRRSNLDSLRTHVTVVPEKAAPFVVANPGAPTDFGRLEGSLSVSGVKDTATAARLAQTHLTNAAIVQREDAVTYAAARATFLPGVDFEVGDLVIARLAGGRESRRVVEVVTERTTDGVVNVSVTFDFRQRSLLARIAGRVVAGSSTSLLGGTGAPLPSAGTPYQFPPKAPTALAVSSNTGYWGDGNVPYAHATITWAAVTQGEDNTPITVVGYDCWVKFDSGEWTQTGSVASNTLNLEQLRPGVAVSVKIVARSVAGGTSVESSVLTFTAATPYVIPPAPTPLALTTRLGIVSAWWDGNLVGALTPSLERVETEFTADSLSGEWIVFDAPLKGTGSVSLSGRPLGELVTMRAVAVGIMGDRVPGATSQITVLGVTGPDIEANSITANNIAAGTLTVNELSPTIGGDLDLSANDTITLIAGQVSDAQDQADAAADTANGAASDASDALDAITITQTAFQVRSDGAYVTSPQTEYELALIAGEIDILYNGGIVSSWDADVMSVPKLVTTTVIIGAHQFASQGAHTSIRAV